MKKNEPIPINIGTSNFLKVNALVIRLGLYFDYAQQPRPTTCFCYGYMRKYSL